MRIVMVSAHFPPNFVSGGTLVPQRMARGLRQRGHEISVFAGWLGASRAPLSTWEEPDESGLAVRWIAIAPWTGWSDRHNFSNPPVAEAFERYLDEVRPEVVHLHALQSMGGGLVDVATRRGCAVVVTMHDFWWICARQFLADRNYRPCCLVVEAGSCECEVDRLWLRARTELLGRSLAQVDLILAPSVSAAKVLRANGVPPDRIEVDENGLPPESVSRHRNRTRVAGQPPPAAPLSLVYAGGPDRMKGAQVLVDAAVLLAGRPGWRLLAYGLDGATAPTACPIEVRPPFAEHELPQVLGVADVLVLPSIMRETFSLLTREALSQGVPVLATDTLGPEEVIRDGDNGLIVAAGDPEALAAAIARLLDEPCLLATLRSGCQQAIEVRSLEDQVAGLERRYSRLVESRGLPARRRSSGSPRVKRVVFAVGIDGAPLRYRVHLPAEAMALIGVTSEVRHYRHPELPDLLAEADAAVFYRVPATRQVLELISSVRQRGRPVIFDVDDLIFDPTLAAEIPALAILGPAEAALWLEGVRRYRTTMEACDLFVGSTEMLCEHATATTGIPARHFANGTGVVLSRYSEAALHTPREPGPPRISYFSGTTTHDLDWAMVEGSVLRVLTARPDVELWLGGHLNGSAALDLFGDRVRRLPPVHWTRLPALLRATDINLAPLARDSRFNEAKSAIKWLEAALVETPTISSPTQPFREAVRHGLTGMLASSDGEWTAAIEDLLDHPAKAATMGRLARRDALLTYSPHLQGERYRAILDEATALVTTGPVRRPSSAWIPIVHDEPPMLVTIERYGRSTNDQCLPRPDPPTPPGPVTTRQLTARLAGLTRTAGRSLRDDGLRSMASRTIEFGRRQLQRRIPGQGSRR